MSRYVLRRMDGTMLGATPLTPHGQWLDPMYVEILAGGTHRKVFTDCRFRDKDGTTWVITDGFVSDGANIPRAAWSIVGGPWNGPYVRAAVLHDCVLAMGMHPFLAHQLFYDAMLADGCDPEQAELFFNAVISAEMWSRFGALRKFLTSSWRVLRPLLRRVIPRL